MRTALHCTLPTTQALPLETSRHQKQVHTPPFVCVCVYFVCVATASEPSLLLARRERERECVCVC